MFKTIKRFFCKEKPSFDVEKWGEASKSAPFPPIIFKESCRCHKYNIGDKVYYINYDGVIEERFVCGINIFIGKPVLYDIRKDASGKSFISKEIPEDRVFITKDDLVQNIINGV